MVENVVVGGPDDLSRFNKDDELLPTIDWELMPGLADLVVGESVGRTGDDEITVFLNRGLGVQFLATAPYVAERAAGKGLGIRLSDDVFRQNLKP